MFRVAEKGLFLKQLVKQKWNHALSWPCQIRQYIFVRNTQEVFLYCNVWLLLKADLLGLGVLSWANCDAQ